MKKGIKYSLYGLLTLIILLIIAIPLIPADRYRQEIEIQISKALQVDVTLGDIGLTSLPQPGLLVKDIQLSDQGQLIVSVAQIHLIPKLSSLFSEQPEIREIRLSGIRLDIQQIAGLAERSGSGESSDSPAIAIRRITGDNSYLRINDAIQFGPFEFSLDLNRKMGLKTFSLSLEKQYFQLDVEPQNNDYAINLQAKDWAIPFEPRIQFSSLEIDGLLQKNRFHAKNIQAIAYEGKLNGNLILAWKNNWALDSRLEVTGLDLAGLLELFDNQSLDGTASGQFTLRANAVTPQQLADALTVSGDVQIVNGHLYNTDLEQAARSFSKDWNAGGQTPFDEFKTHVEMQPNVIRLTQTKITSDLLGIEGHLNIYEMNELKGEMSVGLNDPTGILTMPLMVAGTVDEPRVRPTNSALAGAAAGTALLGPGVGTAVGVKVGEILGKIGGLFGSDNDKSPKTEQTEEQDDSEY